MKRIALSCIASGGALAAIGISGISGNSTYGYGWGVTERFEIGIGFAALFVGMFLNKESK
jgi:hypothetical protein